MKRTILILALLAAAAAAQAQATAESAGVQPAAGAAGALRAADRPGGGSAAVEVQPAAGRSDGGSDVVRVQPAAESAAGGSATARREWRPSFDEVVVTAPGDIVFVRVPDTEAPRIICDTRGVENTRFSAEVRDRVLRIRERSDVRRSVRTTVEVGYNELKSLSLTDASAAFGEPLSAHLLDLKIGERATLRAEVDAGDLLVELLGDGQVSLTGCVRYLTLDASAGRFDSSGMECMAARVVARNRAQVRLQAADRLEVRAATGASVRYGGAPSLLRIAEKVFPGQVVPIE